MAAIYIIKNIISQKVYIGLTIQDSYKRIRSHFGSLKSGKHYNEHFQYSWKKHGENAFISSVIVEGDFNNALLNDLEKHYIRLYNSDSESCGYNKTAGGSSHIMSERHKARIGAKIKGKKKSPESVKKANEARMAHFWNSKTTNKVLDTETGIIYVSMRDLCIQLNLNYKSVSTKLSKNYVNYRFRLLNNLDKEPVEIRTNKRKVINIITNVIYDCISDAAKAENINLSTLHKKIKNLSFNDTNIRFIDEQYDDVRTEQLLNVNRKPVLHVATNTVFPSITHAAEHFNICKSVIQRNAKKETGKFKYLLP